MQLEVGGIFEGKVTGITKFGAFVEIGEGKSGMVHISEVSSDYVEDINNHLKINDTVKVKVIGIADDGKISLSIKKAEEKPKFQRQKRPSRTVSPRPDSSAMWTPRREEPASFEEMMAKF